MSCARQLVTIPMKDPAAAKTRLGSALDPAHRAALTETLFALTLQRLMRIRKTARHRFDIATVTPSPQIADRARAAGIAAIEQGPLPGLNAAVAYAADWAHQAGYAAMAILPGDLAAPSSADLLTLLDRPANAAQAVICEASDGGTNALILPLPARMDFHYGPDSFKAHLAAMRRAGLNALHLHLASLRHDVDRHQDLIHLPDFVWRPAAEALP